MYRAVIKDIKIESNSIDVLIDEINTRIGFPIVSRDSIFNYFNRPYRMKSKLKAYESLSLSRDASKNEVQ
jgi:hypothetical protein